MDQDRRTFLTILGLLGERLRLPAHSGVHKYPFARVVTDVQALYIQVSLKILHDHFREPLVDSTSVNLLQRLKSAEASDAWTRFVELYSPLIFHWARQHGLQVSDASDLVQDILATLVVKLRSFEYDSTQRFRGWLRKLTRNRAIDFLRTKTTVPSLCELNWEELEAKTELDLFEQQEYQNYILQRARTIMQTEFEPTTWQAFWLYVSGSESALQIANQLGVSENSVRVSKCRVLRELRHELRDLIE